MLLVMTLTATQPAPGRGLLSGDVPLGGEHCSRRSACPVRRRSRLLHRNLLSAGGRGLLGAASHPAGRGLAFLRRGTARAADAREEPAARTPPKERVGTGADLPDRDRAGRRDAVKPICFKASKRR